MSGRYRTIVADPPWERVTTRMGRGGRRANSTTLEYAERLMSTDAICALPIAEMAPQAEHLYLWATRRAFREGEAAAVARAWGFEPVGELIWGLRNSGMGSGLTVNAHEPVLLATRGPGFAWTEDGQSPGGVYFFWKQVYRYNREHGVPEKVHSAKPPLFTELVERTSPGPYLELFSREGVGRIGWSYWGDQSLGTAEMPEAA